MPRRRIVAALAVLLLIPMFATTVAHASSTGNPWPYPMICTQATFTSYHAEYVKKSLVIYLTGSIQPCPGVTDPGARRSFVEYGPDVNFTNDTVPILDPATQTYTFNVSGALTRGFIPYNDVLLGGTYAVCLIDGLTVQGTDGVPSRRACVSVTQHATTVDVAPIPTTDPRVTKNISDIKGTGSDDPHCDNCV